MALALYKHYRKDVSQVGGRGWGVGSLLSAPWGEAGSGVLLPTVPLAASPRGVPRDVPESFVLRGVGGGCNLPFIGGNPGEVSAEYSSVFQVSFLIC